MIYMKRYWMVVWNALFLRQLICIKFAQIIIIYMKVTDLFFDKKLCDIFVSIHKKLL